MTETVAHAERVTPTPGSPWWGEHRSRYHFAGPFVRGCRVLDIACGTGFGSTILRNAGADSVLGMDLARDALAEAGRSRGPRVAFVQGDGTRLPLRDRSVDAITSFETLEHVAAFEAFLGDLRRVLADDGVLILSTPNALFTKPVNGKPRNPFHVREFTPRELRELLDRYFSRVDMLGQRVATSFRPCPYWDMPETLPRDWPSRARVLLWKLENRLPGQMRDRVCRIAHRRAFNPGEHDFVFLPQLVDTGHVLVAVCRP